MIKRALSWLRVFAKRPSETPAAKKKTDVRSVSFGRETAISEIARLRRRARDWNIWQMSKRLRRNGAACRRAAYHLKTASSEEPRAFLKARLHDLLLMQNVMLGEIATRVVRGAAYHGVTSKN
jgi:hypothetical protein